MSCVFVTGIVLRFLEVSQSLSIKNKIAAMIPIRHWFDEWNTRGKVLVWDIKQFFHKENQTIVEWYFKNKMNNGNIEEFDGISLIVWTENNKIMELKEFGCNLNTYNPYAQNDMPQFRDEKTKWF